MNAPDDLSAWVMRAEEDYLLSSAALHRKNPLTYGATFHAQQCVEKYLKALLLQRGVAFPRTHDLAALGVLCHRSGLILPVSEDDLELLNAFAVEVRYPGTQPLIEEARKALQIAKSVRKFARHLLPG